jgi:hypothetical protein
VALRFPAPLRPSHYFHVVAFGAMRLTLADSVRCNILSQLRLNVAAMAVAL